jgi:hypothetical protein
MVDIFISYSSKDRDLAASLAAALEANGFSVWWDFNLVGGANFRKQILEQLNEARAVVVIWTENSVTSEFVLDEADHAAFEKKLIPVRHDKLEVRSIPLGYRGAQTYPVSDIARITAALKASGVDQARTGEGAPQRIANSRPKHVLLWRAVYACILVAGILGVVVYILQLDKRPKDNEDTVWLRAKTAWTREAMRDYLETYPDGFYRKTARALIESDMGVLCAKIYWRVRHPLSCHEIAIMDERR